ncbi:MAG: hypothetical protein HYT94_02500 [Parcubacteria group bacterium]|nr:hypothetical protein [Parcubacteria group bacterium]
MQYAYLLNLFASHKRSMAFVLLFTLLSWSLGLPSFINKANAANLTFVADTLSDSGPSVVSNHTVQFHNTNAVTSGQTVTLTFPAGFNLTGIVFTDVDMASTTGESDIVDSGPSTSQWDFQLSGQSITLTSGGSNATIPANSTTTIEIGTNATTGGAGANRITNPTAGSYEISVSTPSDSGNTRVMILSKVTVTAVVNTSFTFTVAGINAGTVIAGATTTTATSTATTMPFATTTVGAQNTIAQTLSVTTNARNGFVVTVNADQRLTSATGADIDRFIDDAGTATPVAWTSPAGTLGNEATYGHEGVSSDDNLNSNEFNGGLSYAGNFVGNARQVFSHDGPSDGTTDDIGDARVLYSIQIGALQEAGNDYTQTLTYVATPTF